MSVLLPLSNAAKLDQEDQSLERTGKWPLLPYERNKFFLSESETGMTTFERHPTFIPTGDTFKDASAPRHQGVEFTLAVLSACEGYVNEPHLGRFLLLLLLLRQLRQLRQLLHYHYHSDQFYHPW